MAYNITLEGENLIEAESLLKTVTDIFEQHKIAYWLEGGTLLGIRRENRLLPWDNDIDISIHSSEVPRLASLIKDLKRRGYRLRERRYSITGNLFKRGDLRMIKIRKRRFFGLIKGKVCLDVFIKYTVAENLYWEVDNKTFYVPTNLCDTFKTITFKHKNYPIPENTDAYLTYRYGDWKTPVKEWNTSIDDKAIA